MIETSPNETIDLSIRITNYGNALSSRLFLTTELDGEELDVGELGRVHPGQSVDTSLSFVPAEPGTYWLHLTLLEGDRSNLQIIPLFVTGEEMDSGLLGPGNFEGGLVSGGIILIGGAIFLLLGIMGFIFVRKREA
jgi:hypothetical protein